MENNIMGEDDLDEMENALENMSQEEFEKYCNRVESRIESRIENELENNEPQGMPLEDTHILSNRIDRIEERVDDISELLKHIFNYIRIPIPPAIKDKIEKYYPWSNDD